MAGNVSYNSTLAGALGSHQITNVGAVSGGPSTAIYPTSPSIYQWGSPYHPSTYTPLVGETPKKKTPKDNFAASLRKVQMVGDYPDTGHLCLVLGESNPIYAKQLRRDVLNLLLLSQSKRSMEPRYRLYCAYGLAEALPWITGKRKRTVFLSYPGFLLLEAWSEKFPKFKPYYEVFQRQPIRELAAEFFTTRKLGQEPVLITQMREQDLEEAKKVAAKEAERTTEQRLLELYKEQAEQWERQTELYRQKGEQYYGNITLSDLSQLQLTNTQMQALTQAQAQGSIVASSPLVGAQSYGVLTDDDLSF